MVRHHKHTQSSQINKERLWWTLGIITGAAVIITITAVIVSKPGGEVYSACGVSPAICQEARNKNQAAAVKRPNQEFTTTPIADTSSLLDLTTQPLIVSLLVKTGDLYPYYQYGNLHHACDANIHNTNDFNLSTNPDDWWLISYMSSSDSFSTTIQIANSPNAFGCPPLVYLDTTDNCPVFMLHDAPPQHPWTFLKENDHYFLTQNQRYLSADPNECDRHCHEDLVLCTIPADPGRTTQATQWYLFAQPSSQQVCRIRSALNGMYLVHQSTCCVSPCMSSNMSDGLWVITSWSCIPNKICIQAYQGSFHENYLSSTSSAACKTTNHAPSMASGPTLWEIAETSPTYLKNLSPPFQGQYLTGQIGASFQDPSFVSTESREWDLIVQPGT